VTVKVTFEFETTQEFLGFFSNINQENTVKLELPAKVESQVAILLPEVEQTVEEQKTPDRSCNKCGATDTPSWRYVKSKNGPLCNKCGIQRRKKEERARAKKHDRALEEKEATVLKDTVKETPQKRTSSMASLSNDAFQKLFNEGFTAKQAAEKLGKGKGSAYHWARTFGKKWPRVSSAGNLSQLQSKIAKKIVSPTLVETELKTPSPAKAKKPTKRNKSQQFSLVYEWLGKGISDGRVSTEAILAEMRVPDQDIEQATEICVELMEAACSMYPNDWACVSHPSDSGVTITTLLSFNLQAKLPSLEELRQH
jgi:hypothetical protein